MHRTSPRRLRFALAASLGLPAALAGCNFIGPAVSLVTEEKIPAAYTLEAARPTVIFIDDRASVLPSRAVRQRIASTAEQALLEEKVLTADLVSSDSLTPVLAAERFGKPRSIAEIGQAVGADVVIYARVEAFTLSAEAGQYSPTAVLRVKVLDAKTGKRQWPADDQKSGALTVNIPIRTTNLPTSTADRAHAELELAELAGRRLAQLFFKHNRHERSEKIGVEW